MRNIPMEQLVDVARSARREDRSALAEAIGELCLKTGRNLSDREKTLAYEIISALIRDVETRVRSALANRLADQRDAPHNLMVTLANDVIEVASPVIVRSVVLQDEDLVDLILMKAEAHQMAITQRDELPTTVTDTLVQTENSSVIAAALSNDSAQFSENALEDVVDMARENEALQGPLIHRNDLSSQQARKMYEYVGFAMRKALEEKVQSSEISLEMDMDAFVDQAVAEALEQDDFTSPLEQPEGFAGADFGFKTHPRLLVGALEQNDLFRFEELFQEATDLTEQGATRVLYDSGPEAIAIACKATGFDRKNFGDLVALLQGGGEPEKYRQTAAYVKIMDYFERIDQSGADRVMSAWRKAPDDSWVR